MKRSEDGILTTHVGSLVRPQALLDLAGYKLGPPKDPSSCITGQQIVIDGGNSVCLSGRAPVHVNARLRSC
jgi:hypothetical protein